MAERFDAIVIGTGQAGPALAVRLAGAGWRAAIVERHRFGGTCVNTGCIPTKTLVASAYAAQLARRAAEYGVDVGAVSVDMKRVKARKDGVSGASSSGVESWLRSTPNVTVVNGHARFESATAVRVGDRVLEAQRIFVNVGGRALVPPMPGLAGAPFFTNSSIMDVDFLPPHLIVVGGSYIGLEFAQMYRRFGSRVTVVEKLPRIIAREDAEVSEGVATILSGEGIAIETGAECMAVARAGDEIVLDLDCDDGERSVRGSHLLLAVGRTPNTDDLGLDRAGVSKDARGYITVDDALRTNVPGIFALGECNGRGAFTHTAYNDYEIAADNLLSDAGRSVRDRINAYALFVDPPLARIGMSDEEIRESGRRALVGKRPMTRVGRAVEKGETQGFMKIAVDAGTKEILGATILGVGGDEAIHCVLDVMYAGVPYTAMQRMVHIHPTVAELLPTLLGELQPLA
ncbi:MAG TPA: FAD-containing oxidoreductase [Casimicrobiaceae bacterium]|nr:FAD-containing oxidoreductase [Casimicrobiaceae bacterium]